MSKKISVLLVDDNKNFIELLKDRIEFSDTFEVAGEAYDGERALELILALRPGVIILDMIMPHLDGLGVLERFKNAKIEGYAPKFLVLSAIGQESLTSRAIGLGATYYMVKPADFDVLITRLEQMVKSGEIDHQPELTYTMALQRQVTEVLQALGVPPHIKGFLFLKEAVILVCEDETHLMRITKSLYPSIAERYDSTPQRVERSIRNAVELTFERGNVDWIAQFFKMVTPLHGGRITNGEFVAYIAHYVTSELEKNNIVNPKA
jgi:two-component system response regulator (stage 0 sporulation protein A)